jgi:proline iminopeptidase
MKKHTVLISLLFVAAWLWPIDCFAQQEPREGYVHSPDGVRLFYKVVGAGKDTLIAVHGGPGNTLESILPDLAPLAQNRRVIYYDQRGGGRSDLLKTRDQLAIAKHIEDLETIRRHFKLDKLKLLGNSWGGILIAYYAVAHPDRVERMVLHNPGEPTKAFLIEAVQEIQDRVSRRYTAEQRRRFALISNPNNLVKAKDPRALCREWFQMLGPTYVAKPESLTNFKGDVCAGPDEAVRYQQFVNMQIWNSLGEFDLLPSLKVVKAPVLVIHGAADPIPIESSEAWATGFPNARLLLIKDAGHISHVEQPEIFFPAVETFLSGSFPESATKVHK